MLPKELLRKAVSRSLSHRLGFALTVELVLGLFSAGVIALFAQKVEEVVDGESRWFEEAALVWIKDNFLAWLDEPMLLGTALGYHLMILSLLVAGDLRLLPQRREDLRYAAPGGHGREHGPHRGPQEGLQRARPELFDSSYSFPSGHATLFVGFYGTLALLLAWRLEGFWRWTVATAGVVLVLLIDLSPHVLRRPLPGGRGRRLSRGASLHARPQG
jgi:undecaprenyl-diphosphatase